MTSQTLYRHPNSQHNRKLGAFWPFPKNAWYVIAGAQELKDKPIARQVANEAIMLFRKSDGEAIALRDACPHRGLPLSKGLIKGDEVQCRYHGITFNADGRCTRIPANPASPIADTMRVMTYPTIEKWHWIWVWTGDAEKADAALLPDFECEQYTEYDHRFYSPLGPILGNLQLLNDNLCDATHTSYLHAGLLDDAESTEMALAEPEIVQMDDRTVRVRRHMFNFTPNDDVAKLYHLEPGQKYNRRLEVWHHFPSSLVAFNRYFSASTDLGQDNPGQPTAEHITALGLTPANERESYHFTAASTSWKQSDHDRDTLLYVINQDIEAFSDIQRYYESHDDAKEISVPTDRLGMMSRRIILNMVRAEQQ